MKSFKEQYEELFNSVARAMGHSWRVNQLDQRTDRIKLTSSECSGYYLDVCRTEDRISISAYVPEHNQYGYCSKCTVSTTRPARQIAADIIRKVQPEAQKCAVQAAEYQASKKAMYEDDEILKGVLRRLVNVSSGHQVFCCWDLHKLHGAIEQDWHKNYRLKVQDLTKDELIRIIGFISTLRGNDERRSNE